MIKSFNVNREFQFHVYYISILNVKEVLEELL